MGEWLSEVVCAVAKETGTKLGCGNAAAPSLVFALAVVLRSSCEVASGEDVSLMLPGGVEVASGVVSMSEVPLMAFWRGKKETRCPRGTLSSNVMLVNRGQIFGYAVVLRFFRE